MLRLGHVHALLYLGGEAVEGLFDVGVVLGGDLEEGDAEFVGELLALFDRDGAFLLPVAFITDQNLVDALASVLFDV